MSYETIEVKPLTLRIGAEISGIDLGGAISNRQREELHEALADHQVIFFRDQKNRDHESHKAFGRMFGKLAIHSGVPGIEGHPEIVAIHADANSKFVAGESWHSDLTAGNQGHERRARRPADRLRRPIAGQGRKAHRRLCRHGSPIGTDHGRLSGAGT